MNKKILLITNLYPPQELGGYGRCMSDFAWGLIERGNHVEVMTSDAPYLGRKEAGPNGEKVRHELILKGSFKDGVSFIRDPQTCKAIDQSNNLQIYKALNESNWDGVLLGNIDLLGPQILGNLVNSKLPIIHHIGFIAAPYELSNYPISANYLMVAASNAVKESLLKEGFPIKDNPVIYPGARVELFGEEFTKRPLPIASKLNIFNQKKISFGTESNPLKICFAGLLMGSKGAHNIIEAIIMLKKENISIQCMLAGEAFQNGYKEALETELRNNELTNLILFTGNLRRDQLARMFGLHHIGIFPSIYPEAFGIVGAEMQASGIALITSGVGGSSELVKEGETGLFFKPGNSFELKEKLKLLIKNPDLINYLGGNGKKEVRKTFSVQRSCEELEKLFSGI